ncbi:iron uptake porin [Lyngbya aestuarii]|uniref:iron uptake porin n=1 Tax=Lyngbya aestuarii TaxID=118322 RepID=UPI00403D81BB
MSGIVWKSLLISPALLGATLVVSVENVRAADGANLLATEGVAIEEGNQLREGVTSQASSMAVVTVPTTAITPLAQEETVIGKVANQGNLSSKNAEIGVLELVAPEAQPLKAQALKADQLAPTATQPKLETTVAQATPGTGGNSEILNQINRYSNEGSGNSQNQVTNIEQLRDVSPGDWAYEALRSLVERYQCIVGYPDGTYRGQSPTTRYEFAAGLNSCLNQIERLIISQEGAVTREDLETLQRLIQEFEAELATLGTRVDNLEGRVGFLEDHQFSTTTKLSGEAIFAVSNEFNYDNEFVLQDRVRLDLNTSFTGQDRLVTRLAAGNAQQFSPFDEPFPGVFPGRESGQGVQTFDVVASEGNDVVVDWLAYYSNFGASRVYIAATGGIHSDYAPTLNPYFEDFDGGNGALSTFASESPIYRIGGGAGGAISLGVGLLDSILGPSTLTAGYLAGPDAADPSNKNGLFDGDYAAFGQLNFNLGDRIGIGATFVHGYHNSGSAIFDAGGARGGNPAAPIVGSLFANNPSSVVSALNPLLPETPLVTNSYGVEAAFRLTNNISISGFGVYTDAILIGQGGAEIWSYGGGLALSDLGKEGNVLGIFGGAVPYLGSATVPGQDYRNENTPIHIEGFYKYQVTDNISVTPGVIWLINPEETDDEDAIIGTLRTTFTF